MTTLNSIELVRRQILPAERDVLSRLRIGYLHELRVRRMSWGVLGYFGALGAWFWLPSFVNEPLRLAFAIASAAVGVVFLVSLLPISLIANRDRRIADRKIQVLIGDGIVSVQRVRSDAVVEVIEREDEGPGFFFEVGDHQMLCLQGQELYPALESPWPNNDFEVVRTSGGCLVGIFCHGSCPRRYRSVNASVLQHALPADQVVPATFETLETDLQNLAERDRKPG